MKIYCTISFDSELWEEINSETDEKGQITLGEGDIKIQVMPIEEFRFMPGEEQVIELIVKIAATGAYNIATGIFTAWLWKKIERGKNEKLQINGKDFKIQDREELENIMRSNDEMNDGNNR